MLKKISVLILIILFVVFILIFCPKNKYFYVAEIVSPVEIILNNGEKILLDDVETFDASFSEKNKRFATKLNITEEDAFILGNLAKYWTNNLMLGREVKLKDNDLVYNKISYYSKFCNSAFCIKNGEIANKQAFEKLIKSIKGGRNKHTVKYVIFDTDNETIYPVSKNVHVKNFIVIRKSSIKTKSEPAKTLPVLQMPPNKIVLNNIKIILSDFTEKLKPDRNCSTDICREILDNINKAQNSIDIAIYGYTSTPAIETAIKNAIKRGVKIRLVYDSDTKGENIYPDTFSFASLIPDCVSDAASREAGAIMHNKFYIFDDTIVITGSANLSHTDMSGYNSNSIVVINSPSAAFRYKQEFEQMYSGRFHSEKISFKKGLTNGIDIYFSPKDRALADGVLPLIQEAEKYVYAPVFLITDKNFVEELIIAKQRGVDVKVIVDALNASSKYSRHEELRKNGVRVKVENYAGKMHSKSIIIDDKYVVIGSMNFSKSGENKNDENLIIFKNQAAAEFYKKFFLYQWQKIPDKWLKSNPRAEGIDSIGSCTDGIDNDYDGLTDKDDTACKSFS